MITAFFLISTLLFSCSDKPHLPDNALEDIFRQHEADFNKLIDMSNADSRVVRIAPDFTRLENNYNWPRPESELGFSKARWDEYRQLFKNLGLEQGITRPTDNPDLILLTASSRGLSVGGSLKGYAYSTKELSPQVNSLDHIPLNLSNGRPIYKPVKEHWYLYYWEF